MPLQIVENKCKRGQIFLPFNPSWYTNMKSVISAIQGKRKKKLCTKTESYVTLAEIRITPSTVSSPLKTAHTSESKAKNMKNPKRMNKWKN